MEYGFILIPTLSFLEYKHCTHFSIITVISMNTEKLCQGIDK